MSASRPADVCLVLEGTYPYVTGGVSNWAHDLIRAQDHLSFHLVALVPPGPTPPLRFELPPNVIGLTTIELQRIPAGTPTVPGLASLLRRFETPLLGLTTRGSLTDVATALDVLREAGPDAGSDALLNSHEAWDLLVRMYERQCPHVSFLDYF